MESFYKEQTFANFDDFERQVQIYQQATGYTLSTIDSRISKPVHKFYYNFKVLHCQKSGAYKAKGKGIRNKESKKNQCPFYLRIKVSQDLSHLIISKLDLIHNHAPNDNNENNEINYVDDGTPLWTDPEVQMQVDEDLAEKEESKKVIEETSSLEQSFKDLSTLVDDSDLEQDSQEEDEKTFAPEETNNEVPLKKKKLASRGHTRKESSPKVDNINSVPDFEIKEQRIFAIKKKEIILPFEKENRKGRVQKKEELSTLVDNSVQVKEPKTITPEKKNIAVPLDEKKRGRGRPKKELSTLVGNTIQDKKKKTITPEKKNIAGPLEKKNGIGQPKKELSTLVDNTIQVKEKKTIVPEKKNIAEPLEKKKGRGRPKKELPTLVDNSIQVKEQKTIAPEKQNIAKPIKINKTGKGQPQKELSTTVTNSNLVPDLEIKELEPPAPPGKKIVLPLEKDKKKARGRPKKSATTTAIGMTIKKVELKAFVDCSEKSQLHKILCWLGVNAEISNKIITGEYVIQSSFLEPFLIDLVDPLLNNNIDFHKYANFFDKKALNSLISAQCNQRKTRIFKCQQCSLTDDKEKILCTSCLWLYHPKCVRVASKNVKGIEKYFCKLCKKK